MKYNLLILLAALCAAHGHRTRHTKPTVAVEVDMPWHVQFSIPSHKKFQPLSLRAKVRHPTESTERHIEFQTNMEGSSKIFRNLKPERLRVGDVLYAVLEYKTKGRATPVRVQFNYTIQTKQFDMLNLNTELEYDASDDEVAESDEYDDMLDDTAAHAAQLASTTMNSIPTQQHAAPSNMHAKQQVQNTNLFCLSPELLVAKAAENKYLQEQLKSALEIGKIGTRLVLTGSLPPGNNAADAIRALITDKLQLPQLSQSILQARFLQDELLFELATPQQKVEVLTKARMLLQRSPYKIAHTDRDVFEVSMFLRANDLH